MPRSAKEDGAAVSRAEIKNREVDYPDIEASPHAALLSLGSETYGRWSSHCLVVVRQLARYKSRNSPEHLQKSVQVASFARWWNLLSCSVQTIVADSILRLKGSDLFEGAETTQPPPVEELLDLHR